MLKQKNGVLEKIENKFHPIAEIRHNSKRYLNREYEEKWQMIQDDKLPEKIHDYGWDNTKFGMISSKVGYHGKLLDVGCGIGNFCRYIQGYSPYMEVHGIDKSPKAIEISQKLSKEAGMKQTYQEASVYKLPYKDETFDYVVSNDVLEHLRKPKKAIIEQKRVLKKGGKIFLTMPWYQLVNKKKEPGHRKEWTPREFLPVMKELFGGGEVAFPPRLVNRQTGEMLDVYWFLTIAKK